VIFVAFVNIVMSPSARHTHMPFIVIRRAHPATAPRHPGARPIKGPAITHTFEEVDEFRTGILSKLARPLLADLCH
jgi:hypothetical protein